METQVVQDIGEEIISKLKELNRILDQILQDKDGKKLSSPCCIGE